jgi:hypothetical protein
VGLSHRCHIPIQALQVHLSRCSRHSKCIFRNVPAAAVAAPAVVVTAVATAARAADASVAIVAFASNANGFLLFGCERVGVPKAFRLPGVLPGVSVAGFSALPGVTSVTICGSNGNAA